MTRDRRIDLSARHVVRGALVSLGGSMGSRLLGLLAMAVLARLLLPHDFGVVATAMVFIGFCRALMNRQFHLAMVRLPLIDRSHLDTAFTLSLIWGLAAGGGLFLAADLLARMVNTSEIVPVLRLMSLALVIEGFSSPAFIRYERNLDLRPEVVADWTGKVAQYATSIGMALWWQSHWALVFGFLVFSIGRVAVSHAFAPHRPRLRLSHAREFLSFGGWLTGTGVAGYAIGFSDVALVAARAGTASVGFYNLAAEIVRMATDYLAMPLGRAIYPGLSAIAHDRVRLRGAFLDALEVLLGLMLPIGVGLSLVAPEMVRLLLGGRWADAVPVIQILAPAAAFSTISFAAQSIVMAEGRTRAMFGRNVAVAAVQVPLIWFGISWAGMIGAAAGRAAGMLLHGVLSLVIAAPLAGVGIVALVVLPWRSIIACTAMAGIVVWLDRAVLASHAAAQPDALFLSIALKATVGALAYVVVHGVLWVASGRPRGVEHFVLARLLPALR